MGSTALLCFCLELHVLLSGILTAETVPCSLVGKELTLEFPVFPLLLTLLAGLSTGIGGGIALLTGHTSRRFLSVSLGFSAGVMIYVSLVEILASARELLSAELTPLVGGWAAIASFFGGILLIAVIDKLIPAEENPHEVKLVEDATPQAPSTGKLLRTGALTALAITIHNFPEGIATFFSALQEPSIAVPIVAAIAIHNIPEGIAVAVPICHATGSRAAAFRWAFLSGLAEPAGALIGWVILTPIMNDAVFGAIFAGVAGIMVFISFDELLPAAREYGEHHLSLYGLIGGMLMMAISLQLFP